MGKGSKNSDGYGFRRWILVDKERIIAQWFLSFHGQQEGPLGEAQANLLSLPAPAFFLIFSIPV
jgi:hypothetical protein